MHDQLEIEAGASARVAEVVIMRRLNPSFECDATNGLDIASAQDEAESHTMCSSNAAEKRKLQCGCDNVVLLTHSRELIRPASLTINYTGSDGWL